MSRKPRIDYPGALHHVITRGIERSYIFKEEHSKKQLLKRIKRLLKESSMVCYAWSIMDNHFHILLQTGETGITEFMRRLLTGYAIWYNLKHKRKGYLFENRYKSIVCDKDEYLLPLIRYIHLNPVKAKKIDIKELNSYLWTGHRELASNFKEGVIEEKEVLGYFGKTIKESKKGYIEYVEKGVDLDEDYSGGGLVRSASGIKEVIKERKEEMYDERILGNGKFAESILNQDLDFRKYEYKEADEILEKVALYYGFKKEEILEKKRVLREARNVFIYLSLKYLDITGTELGRIMGTRKSAISIAKNKGKELIESGKVVIDDIL